MSSLAHTDDDRRADSADAAQTLPDPAFARFYAVPWDAVIKSGELISLTCMYFNEEGRMVDLQPMAHDSAFFWLIQGGPNTTPKLPMPPQPLDVELFSATARTLTKTCPLNSTFTAGPGPDGAPAVLVPVAPRTTRGVILVFRYPATGVVQGLVATSDPEIKNTSGTSEQPA